MVIVALTWRQYHRLFGIKALTLKVLDQNIQTEIGRYVFLVPVQKEIWTTVDSVGLKSFNCEKTGDLS